MQSGLHTFGTKRSAFPGNFQHLRAHVVGPVIHVAQSLRSILRMFGQRAFARLSRSQRFAHIRMFVQRNRQPERIHQSATTALSEIRRHRMSAITEDRHPALAP